MEVLFQAARLVANMRPSAMDARIADGIVHDQRSTRSAVAVRDGIAHRRAHLAAVRHVTDIIRAG